MHNLPQERKYSHTEKIITWCNSNLWDEIHDKLQTNQCLEHAWGHIEKAVGKEVASLNQNQT